LTVEASLPSEQRAEQHAAQTAALLQQRARYLVDGSQSPMGVIVSLLAYAKRISQTTPGRTAGTAWWSPDRQTFCFQSHAVHLKRFSAMAQTVVAKAEAILWTELLWAVEPGQRRSVDLAAIQDDLSIAHRGASFLSPALLKDGRD
jgi:hypothetical protein